MTIDDKVVELTVEHLSGVTEKLATRKVLEQDQEAIAGDEGHVASSRQRRPVPCVKHRGRRFVEVAVAQ